ncbi:zinc-dependent metalloprotease [uncultured Kordia sp.]|uniref:zinc-dependent metalloprotease n=1 Tax=uncultured Kordia sp. TaxID=507699 RepID=UPI0026078084|nr:zinc-dependent metalloprotease [uncultured Kordia sp.]
MKTFNQLIHICILFFSYAIVAQNPIYKKVQLAKEETKNILELSVFSKENYKNTEVLKQFDNTKDVHFLQYEATAILQNDQKLCALTLPLGNKTIVLELLEVEKSFYDYQIVTSSGEDRMPNIHTKHFRGIIKNDPNSLVAISFYKNNIIGTISSNETNYTIAKLKGSQSFIAYEITNLKKKPSFECEIDDDNNFKGYDYNTLFNQNGVAKMANEPCVELYFETEFDIFDDLGSLGNVEDYVVGVFNQVAAIYENENINTRLSLIKIWDTTDPYTATNTADLLQQFQNNLGNFYGDLGQLLTFRNAGGGRAAGFNGLCNSNSDNSLSVSANLNDTVTLFPLYSWNVYVIAHEFGHLFGSRHTHACVWNGNNTAIDHCGSFFQFQTGRPIEGENCLDTVNPDFPAAGGTIMSYCHLQATGINFNEGFGAQPGNVIRSFVQNASCLEICCLNYLTITNNVNSSLDNEEAEIGITARNYISNNAIADYHAGQQVLMTHGFFVENANFRGHIEGCTGEYYVTSRVATNNTNIDRIDPVNNKNASLPHDQSLGEIKIYPNPTKGIVTVQFSNTLEKTIEIYTITGISVFTQRIEKEGISNTEIDLSKFQTGIYMMKITDVHGAITIRRIMKQ